MKADSYNTCKWNFLEFPVMKYQAALKLQRDIVDGLKSGRLKRNVVLMLEHAPVFTLGRRGGMEHLLASEDALKRAGIDIVHTERGGDITYHGPGQLILYPIVKLDRLRMSVTDFVGCLEEIMIRIANDHGVAAGRDARNRGVWVGNKKLGSIGVAIRKGVTFHGLALNVNTDLAPFAWMHPCGLTGVEMTSLAVETGGHVPMAAPRASARHHLEAAFNIRLVPRDLSEPEFSFCGKTFGDFQPAAAT